MRGNRRWIAVWVTVALGAAGIAVGAGAQHAAAAGGTFTPDLISTSPGSTVVVSGSGWGPSLEAVDVFVEGSTKPVVTATPAGGSWAAKLVAFEIPGTYTLVACQGCTGKDAVGWPVAELTVVPPTFKATPAAAAPGATVDVAGSGWDPALADVGVYIEGESTPLVSAGLTPAGSWAAGFAASLLPGTYTLVACQGCGGVAGGAARTAQLTVVAPTFTPTFGVAPAAAAPGATVAVAGSGWDPAGKQVRVSIEGSRIAPVTVPAAGSWSTTLTALDTPGTYTLLACEYCSDDAARVSRFAQFTVLAPSFALTPSVAAPGSTVTASALGWNLGAGPVSIFASAQGAADGVPPLATATPTASTGEFTTSLTLPLPPYIPGSYRLFACQCGYPTLPTATALFTLMPAQLRLVPHGGAPRTISMAGSGWSPASSVNLYLGSSPIGPAAATGLPLFVEPVAADGSVATTLTVPAGLAGGLYYVYACQFCAVGGPAANAEVTLQALPPLPPTPPPTQPGSSSPSASPSSSPTASPTAAASPKSTAAPVLALTPASGGTRDTITASGFGWDPALGFVSIFASKDDLANNVPPLATVLPTAGGAYSVVFAARTLDAGAYTLVACQQCTSAGVPFAQAQLTLTATPSSYVRVISIVAGLLAMVVLAVVVIRRVRRARPGHPPTLPRPRLAPKPDPMLDTEVGPGQYPFLPSVELTASGDDPVIDVTEVHA